MNSARSAKFAASAASDPSTYGRLVAGYREGRCLPNFGQRFVELTQEMLQK